MLAAFLLGLAGSFTHCTGMCSGVMLLFARGAAPAGRRTLALHAGRLTTYMALGALAAALGSVMRAPTGAPHHHGAGGHDVAVALPGLAVWQGALALVAATAALYMALALLGRVPSPELLLVHVTHWWGRTARRVTRRLPSERQAVSWPRMYLSGLFWGLLPCGLVLAALLPAVASGSPVAGATTMLAFGVGTLPLGLGIGWSSRQVRPQPAWGARLRPVAAIIVLLFGLQMALRGLAAWGWVAHGNIGAMPLW